jgi:hypothetical protein
VIDIFYMMAYSECPELDLQFSNFAFQSRDNTSDSMLDREIEQIPPHCRSVSTADLHQLSWSLTYTSLDQEPYSQVDYENKPIMDNFAEPLSPSNPQRHITRPLPSSDSQDPRLNSLRTQRKNLARSQTQRSHLRDVEALVQRLNSASSPEFPTAASISEGTSSVALAAMLEEDENEESSNNRPLDTVARQMVSAGYRRSYELKSDRNWVEKPIRIRKNNKRRK